MAVHVVLSVQQVSVPLQHVRFSCSLSFPIFLQRILKNTCRLFCLVFVSFHIFSSSFCYGLACFVVFSFVPSTLAFHLVYLDELILFGSLCFTVRDHIICISLGRRISTYSGCTDDVVG